MMPTWSDKLLQEVIRSLLEAYYEPQFSNASHGFRPGRGCHTALSSIQYAWTGCHRFIEGDIQACFDRLDNQVMLSILAQKIHDNRFLRLIKHLLQAGYLEEWRYQRTQSGTHKEGSFHRSSPISTWINSTTLSKPICALSTHKEQCESTTRSMH